LRPDLDRLRERNDPAIFAKFEQFARAQVLPGGVTVWDWLKGAQPAPEVIATPAVAVPKPAARAARPRASSSTAEPGEGGRTPRKPASAAPRAEPGGWKPWAVPEERISLVMADTEQRGAPQRPVGAVAPGGEKIERDPLHAARLADIAAREKAVLDRHHATADVYRLEARGQHGDEIATWSNARVRALRAPFAAERKALPPPRPPERQTNSKPR
jgi:hypothetical protein